MNQVNLNIDELQDFVGHIITNNRHLQADGKKPVAIEVVGESGIGKTTSIMDMTQAHGRLTIGWQKIGQRLLCMKTQLQDLTTLVSKITLERLQWDSVDL